MVLGGGKYHLVLTEALAQGHLPNLVVQSVSFEILQMCLGQSKQDRTRFMYNEIARYVLKVASQRCRRSKLDVKIRRNSDYGSCSGGVKFQNIHRGEATDFAENFQKGPLQATFEVNGQQLIRFVGEFPAG